MMYANIATPACGDAGGLDHAVHHFAEAGSVVWIGELHGTVQAPRLIGDVVCRLVRQGERVLLFVERPRDEEAALREFVSAKGNPPVSGLLASAQWSAKYQDGRSSVAQFRLLEAVRKLKSEGADIEVRTVIGDPQTTGVEYEMSMAHSVEMCLRDTSPETVAIIFTGSVHASKTPLYAGLGYPGAVAYLTKRKVVAIRLVGDGGAAWNCQADGCGVHSLTASDRDGRSGLRATTASGGYDYVFDLGSQVSPSPPARPWR